MSDLTNRIAAEHDHLPGVGACRCRATIPETGCNAHTDPYTAHVAEVTEAAVRAQIAADIRAARTKWDDDDDTFDRGVQYGMDYSAITAEGGESR